ncbi:hypothetical protein AK830_g10008 [Neonectria ditissima]|uniref:Zn(2)-C6 fungal-type domain-containing protein n=1 Tax=Neonectria ditissima TaxID=78410 RepID=A0A0N8H5L9_9HYPO|nr:hypothetical protein AK830_g10008 [Neonectria ditissima]
MDVAAHARRRKACDFCVSRKIKCDGLKPTCSNCTLYGVACAITAVSSGRRRAPLRSVQHEQVASPASQPDRVDALEARLGNIESHLAQLADATLLTPEVSCRPEASECNSLQPASQGPVREQLELPSLPELLPVVDSYFQNYNRLTPLFDEPTFMRMLLDWYSSPSKRTVVSWAAINVVLAISFRILDDLSMEDPRLSSCVRNVQSTMADLMTWQEDLLGIQVLLGLVVIFQGGPDPQLAIVLIGSAIRLVQRMRLPSKQALIGHSPAVALHRNRIFWIAYILDRDLALRARAPCAQLDSETDIDVPDEDPDDGIDIFYSPNGSVRFNYLRTRVQLAFIQGKVHDVLYSRRAQSLTQQQRLASIARVKGMLFDWHKKIPEEFQQAETIGHLPQMSIQFLTNMYFRHLECLFRIRSVFLFDEAWINRVVCYLSPAVIEIRDDEADSEVMRSNLPPLPNGWAECVNYCRHCLTLSHLSQQTEHSFWLTTCGSSSCLIILIVNMIEFPDHESVAADRDRIDRGREIFEQRKSPQRQEHCDMLAVADQLDRRARGQVKRIARSHAAEFSGLVDDELLAWATTSSPHTRPTPSSPPLSKLTAEFPADVKTLVKPAPDRPGDEHDRGFQRYSTTKLTNVMSMHDLNRRLQQVRVKPFPFTSQFARRLPSTKDPNLSGICVTAMDPGGLVDSRAHAHQKPAVRAMFTVINALLPFLRRFTTEVRRSADSARDLVELSVGDEFKGVRGYHIGVRAAESALVCKDTTKLDVLWAACWGWAGLADHETVLKNANAKTD